MSFSHWLDRIQTRIRNSSRGKVTQKRRLHSRNRLDWLPSLTERLENRTLLSAVMFDAAAATENLTLSLDESGNLQITEKGNVIFSQPMTSVDELTITGNELDNLLIVDTSNGNPVPVGGLFYHGLDQETETGDGLAIFGNGISSATTYQPTDLTDGVLTLDGRVINFTGLEPVLDNIPAVSITINGTGDANTVSYTAGSNGFFTGPSALVAIDAFETIEFNNKTEITINSFGGNDVFNFNNNTTPAGLTTGINLNGGDDDDTFNLLSGASVPLFIDGEAGTDNVQVAGASTGSISVADLTIAAESIGFDINGTTPGTQYDQLVSSGTVDISGVTLSFAGTLSPASGQSFTIIETVGGVIGTFSGLVEGATISNFLGSGLDATISYLGDDAVVTVNNSSELDASIDVGGDLVLNESGGDSVDTLTISTDGTNIILSDASNLLGTGGIAGATGDGTTTITIPLAAFTGDIIINSMGGDDSLTVDLGGGSNFDREITFNGGSTIQTGGDELFLQGGGTFADATFGFDNLTDGSIDVTGNSTINYTGLEPITSTITATNVTLDYSTAAETITVTPGPAGQTTVDSDAGEIITFNNPSGTLEINAGATGADAINVEGLGSGFVANLTINGEGGGDTVNFQTTATSTGGGDLTVDADDINVTATVNSNGGNVLLRSTGDISVAAAINSTGGAITLNSDSDQAVTPSGSINVEMATIDSAGGNIVLGGGADPTMNPAIGTLTNVDEDGVRIHLATITSGAGDISIRGASSLSEDGVDVGDSASILATTGNITIDGAATGMDDGVDIHDGSTISTTSGNITITGTASGGNAEDGVLITGPAMLTTTSVTTETGLITITGNGDDEDSGVQIGGFVLIESTGAAAGAITIDGTSATPELFSEAGTFVDGPVTIRSVTGPIDITGTSSDGDGLVLFTDSLVQSTGTGATAATITLTGDGGLDGVVLFEATVTSIDGNILLDGTGDDFDGVLQIDSLVESTGTTASTAATITILGDTTGNGSDGIAIVDDTTGSAVNSVAGAISLTGTADGASMSLDGVYVGADVCDCFDWNGSKRRQHHDHGNGRARRGCPCRCTGNDS